MFKFFKGIKIGTPSEIALVPEMYLSTYSFPRLDSKEEVRTKAWNTIPDGEKVGQDWVQKNGGK